MSTLDPIEHPIDAPEVPESPVEHALPPPGKSMRVRAARGTIVNAAFEVGLQALGFAKGFVIAAFLTKSEYGVWGILVISLGTLAWLKQVGISEKFVQQDEGNQEEAFQKAFTLEAISNSVLFLLLLVAVPLFALAYGQPKIIVPGLILSVAVLAQTLRAPAWIFYREMNYSRQRLLDAFDPVVSFFVTVALAAVGLGYWSLVIGFVAGVWSAAIASVLASPYKLRFRYDAATMRQYFHFSWPLFIANASGLVIPQASMFVGEATLGLAGAGVINLAGSIAVYTDKVDQIVTWTLYPAVARVKDRAELLYEAFVKTNRLTLMWGVPFGVGVALFAPDLVHFGIGDRWDSAITLVQAFGLIAAANHIGFNWTAFFRARGHTVPLAVVAPITLAAFLVAAVPLLIAFGLNGYAAGMAIMALVSLAARTHYLKKLFPQFRMLRHAARALYPSVPAVLIVLAARTAEPHRTAAVALVEVVLYVALTAAATLVFERRLLGEAVGYLRGRVSSSTAPAVEVSG